MASEKSMDKEAQAQGLLEDSYRQPTRTETHQKLLLFYRLFIVMVVAGVAIYIAVIGD